MTLATIYGIQDNNSGIGQYDLITIYEIQDTILR